MRPVIFRVVGALRPARAAAPFEMPRAHVGPVADAKQERAMAPVGVFVHLAGRMHDKAPGLTSIVSRGVRITPPPSKQK